MLLVVYTNISLRKLPLIIISKNVWNFNFEIVIEYCVDRWQRECMTQSWWGGRPDAPSHQVQSKRCTRPSPTYSMYPPCTSIWGISTSVPRRPKGAHMCTTQFGGGGLRQIPPPTQSAVVPHYNTHNCPSANFDKIPTKQTDRTCWPYFLPPTQLLGMYTSEVSSCK
jgi:hypothetical protein